MAVPVFASTPEQESAPVMNEDEEFNDFLVLEDNILAIIEGNYVIYLSTEPDKYIVFRQKFGNGGYIIVYNDGSAIVVGQYPVNEDGSFGKPDTFYYHNFNITNLNDYIKKQK